MTIVAFQLYLRVPLKNQDSVISRKEGRKAHFESLNDLFSMTNAHKSLLYISFWLGRCIFSSLALVRDLVEGLLNNEIMLVDTSVQFTLKKCYQSYIIAIFVRRI